MISTMTCAASCASDRLRHDGLGSLMGEGKLEAQKVELGASQMDGCYMGYKLSKIQHTVFKTYLRQRHVSLVPFA
jgi:hypothetical protein